MLFELFLPFHRIQLDAELNCSGTKTVYYHLLFLISSQKLKAFKGGTVLKN